MAAKSQKQPARGRGPGRKFQSGKSGNPSGRPKKTQEEYDLEAACRAKAPEVVATLVEIMENGNAESSRIRAGEILLDRGFGKAAQIITGADGKDLFSEVKIVFVAADKTNKTNDNSDR